MKPASVDRRLCAIVVADVVGYSRLMGEGRQADKTRRPFALPRLAHLEANQEPLDPASRGSSATSGLLRLAPIGRRGRRSRGALDLQKTSQQFLTRIPGFGMLRL